MTAVTADLTLLPELSPMYVAFGTARILDGMLRRGFTTVRDVVGADYGIHDAQRDGPAAGPKVLFGGKALPQTGGHGDARTTSSSWPAAASPRHGPDRLHAVLGRRDRCGG